ncbi:MAG: class I SAM-dependent methyltransferase [Candidatus Riflebacteria bacterium]|nr:class I SAM-dependent methyltransferase [Candidatus Riflebacteria bacterium]
MNKQNSKSWDPIWEEIFSSRDWGKYPPEELVRFIARNYFHLPDRKEIKILDAGCGTGACLWFLAREGLTAIGVDGSFSGLLKARSRLMKESLTEFLSRSDLRNLPFKNASFDAVIDISSAHQNRVADIKTIFSEFRRVLKPDGIIFSIMPDIASWGYNTGTKVEDSTFHNVLEGPYKNLGNTHFTSESDLDDFFEGFTVISKEIISRTFENRSKEIRNWVISARVISNKS